MNKQDYRKAMNRIKISDSFQARTAQLMQEVRDGKASEPTEKNTRIYPLENEKRRFPAYIKYGALIAAVAVISFSAGVLVDMPSEDGMADTSASVTAAETAAGASVTDSDDVIEEVMDEDAGVAVGADGVETGEDRVFEDDSVEDDHDDVVIEEDDHDEVVIEEVVEEPPLGIAPSMAPVSPDNSTEAPADKLETTSAADGDLSEGKVLREFLASNDTIGGYADNYFYILAGKGEKAPLSEINSDHAEIEAFPRELLDMTADILENTEPMENAVSPEEYAKDRELYIPLNWNGTAFVYGFGGDDRSFEYTVCGRSLTSQNSGKTYPLTEEQYQAYSQYSVEMVGGTLIPVANPAAEDVDD